MTSTSNIITSNMATSVTFNKHFRIYKWKTVEQTLDYEQWKDKWVTGCHLRMPDESDESYNKRIETAWKVLCDKRTQPSNDYELKDEDIEEDDDYDAAFEEDIDILTDAALRQNEVYRAYADEFRRKIRAEADRRHKEEQAKRRAKKEEASRYNEWVADQWRDKATK